MKNYKCRICLEEQCKGKHNCDCSTCPRDKDFSCPRHLIATIRITNRCTQKCHHCCFSSSPGSKIFMELEMASQVSKFITENEVSMLNVMGGEFFCHPRWFEILAMFCNSGAKIIRLVSNGDWYGNEEVKEKLKALFEGPGKGKLILSISNDMWHTNRGVREADKFLESIQAPHRICDDPLPASHLVPLGRGELEAYGGFYWSWSTYCNKPDRKYSFLIDEKGDIYKCSFGVWKYTNIQNHLDGSFPEKFKEYNLAFYNRHLLACSMCISACRSGYKDIIPKGEEIQRN